MILFLSCSRSARVVSSNSIKKNIRNLDLEDLKKIFEGSKEIDLKSDKEKELFDSLVNYLKIASLFNMKQTPDRALLVDLKESLAHSYMDLIKKSRALSADLAKPSRAFLLDILSKKLNNEYIFNFLIKTGVFTYYDLEKEDMVYIRRNNYPFLISILDPKLPQIDNEMFLDFVFEHLPKKDLDKISSDRFTEKLKVKFLRRSFNHLKKDLERP